MKLHITRVLPALCAVGVFGLVGLSSSVEAKNTKPVVVQQAEAKEANRQAAVKVTLSKEKGAIAVFARGLC